MSFSLLATMALSSVMSRLQLPKDHHGYNSRVKHIKVFIKSSQARSIRHSPPQRVRELQSRVSGFILVTPNLGEFHMGQQVNIIKIAFLA